MDCKSIESKHLKNVVINNLATATEKMQARKRASKMLTATKCNSDLPLKRKKREGKSNTLSTDILIKEIIETKLIEMVNSVEEKFKCGPPHPPPEQRTNEQVAPVTVLVPAAVSP